MTYLFVYGTLRRGERADVTGTCDVTYVGVARARGKMFRVEDHPGMVASDDASDQVVGEVYRLENAPRAWPVLDEYEGDEFERTITSVRMDDGQVLQAWAYFYHGDTSQKDRILSGDYPRQ